MLLYLKTIWIFIISFQLKTSNQKARSSLGQIDDYAGWNNRSNESNHLTIRKQKSLLSTYYRPHPKDGEGNVFSLYTSGGGQSSWGGGSGQSSWGGGGQISPAGGVSHPRGGGGGSVIPSSRGGVSHPVIPGGGGGGQHLAPSCGRYASCVHAGGLSCLWEI